MPPGLGALAIYSGLEIDAAKTGVRPNLDEFLGGRKVKRTPFLQYKYLVERAEERRRAWYEPTHRERLETFFAGIDWDTVDSPVERLPWLARQLERNTPKVQEKPAKDGELFAFAQKRNWKRQLDEKTLSSVSALLWDYEHCLSRIRACRAPAKGQQRKTDIDRILYARGPGRSLRQRRTVCLLPAALPERIAALRKEIVEQQWHLMTEAQRETFLREWLPEGADYYDLLTDFRHGGFRLLGDLVCDIDDLEAARERKQLRRPADSPAFQKMMEAYLSAPFSATSGPWCPRSAASCWTRSSGPAWRCPMWWPWASETCCGICCRITLRNMFWRWIMLNEWKEFQGYTGVVNYTARNKQDTTYLGRFTFDTILDFEGLNRVLTILAKDFCFIMRMAAPPKRPGSASTMPSGACAPGAVRRTAKKPRPGRRGSLAVILGNSIGISQPCGGKRQRMVSPPCTSSSGFRAGKSGRVSSSAIRSVLRLTRALTRPGGTR